MSRAATLATLLALTGAAQAQVIFVDGFDASGQGADPCEGSRPAGFSIVQKSWAQTWRGLCPGSPTYPNSIGAPVPLNGFANTLVVTSWVPALGDTATIFWDRAQVSSGACYNSPKPTHGMYVSISTCPGDVRPRGACGRFGATASLSWSTTLSSPAICTVPAGQPLYMTVMPYDPDTMQIQCEEGSPNACDVQAVHRGL